MNLNLNARGGLDDAGSPVVFVYPKKVLTKSFHV